MKKLQNGFTIIELLVLLAIGGVVWALFTMPESVPGPPKYLVCSNGEQAGPFLDLYLGKDYAEAIDIIPGWDRPSTVYTYQFEQGTSCQVTTTDPNAEISGTVFN